MLDFSFRQAERQAAAFMGQALAFNMNNGTDDGQTASGSGKGTAGGDSITACLDSKRQKIVPIGEYYYSDPCTLCLCSNAEFMCKQISCAPPEKCDGYIKKDPLHCCDVCVPAVVVEKPNDQSSLNMKLGALTVALFLVISLVLFTLHRMRRKRLLITLRRLQSFRHRDSVCSHAGDGLRDYRQSIDAAENGLFSPLPPILSESARAAVIAEGPPPYNAAVTLPRAPETLARAPPRATAPAEPPPTYRQAVQQDAATIRRCTSQNGHRPPSMAGVGRHSRTSDYPDDDDEAEARSTTTYSSSSLSSSSSASSLSSSRDSLHVDDAGMDGEDDCCSCSQCDSGLSEERGSLSSNEVRPRSEVLLTSSASYHIVPGQATVQPQTSVAVEIREEAHSGRSRPETSAGVSGATRETKGKLCKKKLKKLMMKAKRKAKRGRRNAEAGSSANVAGSSAMTRTTAELGDCTGRTTASRQSGQSRENRRSPPAETGVAAMPVTSL